MILALLLLASVGLFAWWFWCQVQSIHDIDDVFDPEDPDQP